MFTYSQTTGQLHHDAVLLGVAYSGHGAGLNNPAMQNVPETGPLPRGTYTIGPAFQHPTKGPVVMHLVADPGVSLFGRSGFLIHGDSQLQNHTGSEGCIVSARAIREIVASSADRKLTVTL